MMRTASGREKLRNIVSIRVVRMWETCKRTTYYVELTTDEGFTMTPVSHRTGSMHEAGLSIEAARNRAIIDAGRWADFLELTAEPYVEKDVTYEPSFPMLPYTMRRANGERDTAKSA